MSHSTGARIRLSAVLHLYRVRARTRLVQDLFAMIGIAAGVALLFASQVASTSLDNSVRQLTNGLVGSSRLQLEARTQEGFPEQLLDGVRALPGVRSATPVFEQQADLIGPDGQASVDLIGAEPGFVKLGGSLLQHFGATVLAKQHAVALSGPTAHEIGVGDLQPVTLQIAGRSRRTLVAITLQEADIGALVHSPLLLASLPYAQQLAGLKGRIMRIFVRPQSGQESRVRGELQRVYGGNLNVLPADFDARLFEEAAAPTNQSTGLFAVISALVGFLFAFNAMLFSAPARRRLAADLRLDGYSSVSVVKVLLCDALVLGISASLLGLVLGDLISIYLFQANPGFLSFAFSVGTQRIVTGRAIAFSLAAGMLAACVGVLVPVRSVIAAHPFAATEPRRRVIPGSRGAALAGAGCLVLTTVIVIAAPSAAVVGVITLTASLLLFLPGFVRGVLYVVERATLDLRVMAPFVAVRELRAPSTWVRTVAVAATGAVAVFGSVSIQGAHSDLQRGLDRSARDVSDAAAIWALPPGESNLLATTPFPASATRTLAALPGVRAVRLYRGGFLDFGPRRALVSAQPRSQGQLIPPHQLVSGDLANAEARLREGGWAVLSRAIAKEHNLRIGDSFVLPSPQPTTFRLAALSTNIGWPPGAVIINAEDYAHSWASQDASAYEITPTAGVSAETVRREVERALGPRSGLIVQTALERERRQRAASRQGLARLSQISAMVLIAAILAMVAAMGNMIWQRRPRLARLKLDAHTDFQVWRALVLESVLLLGSGCALGAAFGLYGQVLGSRAILVTTGFPVVFSVAVLAAVSSFALVTIVAIVVTAIPGYFVARVPPVLGLSD